MILHGKSISPGVAQGPAYVVDVEHSVTRAIDVAAHLPPLADVQRFQNAVNVASLQLERVRQQLSEQGRAQDAAIFAAHATMLADPKLTESIKRKILDERLSAEAATAHVVLEVQQQFRSSSLPVFRERDADVSDIGQRLLACLGESAESPSTAGAVIVAETVNPSDLVRFVHDGAVGVVTSSCGLKSHTAILARGFGVPFVTGIAAATECIANGAAVVLDASQGTVVANPTEAERPTVDTILAPLAQLPPLAAQPLVPLTTLDGVPVTVLINLSDPIEAEAVRQLGAAGVGLFRTEFLYMDRDWWPTERESFEVYRGVAADIGELELHVRLADFGAEKSPPYADMPINRNPSLGVRGVRLLLQRDDILRPQVLALARLARKRPVTVLFPMIDTVDTLLSINERLCAICRCRDREALPFRVGSMIEVPSAALAIDEVIRHVDAVSVGLNDLTQYLLAADRDDELLEAYHDPLQPTVLRLVRRVVETCDDAGKPVTMCGELAGDPSLTRVLLTLGVRRFSVSRSHYANVVQRIRGLSLHDPELGVDELLGRPTGKAVRELIASKHLT